MNNKKREPNRNAIKGVVSMRLLLPVAMVGLACAWAWLISIGFLLLGQIRSIYSIDNIATILGAVMCLSAALTSYVVAKNALFFEKRRRGVIVLFVIAFLSLPVALLAFLFQMDIVPPLFLAVLAWALSGVSFGTMLIKWSEIFVLSWKYDVGIFIAFSVIISGIVFLFASHTEPLFLAATFFLLPCFSLLILKFTYARVSFSDSSSFSDNTEEIEETSFSQFPAILLRRTSFAIFIYGMEFGIVVSAVINNTLGTTTVYGLFLAIAAGSGVYLVVTHVLKRYIPFGETQKYLLLLLITCFLLIVLADPEVKHVCLIVLFATFIFFDLSNYSSLVALSSHHPFSPLALVGHGRVFLPLGVGIGLLGSMFFPWEGAGVSESFIYVVFGLVLVLVITALFMPFAVNKIIDQEDLVEDIRGSRLERRCDEAIKLYKLSNRESDVLPLLAKGRNAKYIEKELFISESTVKTHIYHIYGKMSVGSQQELIDVIEGINPE